MVGEGDGSVGGEKGGGLVCGVAEEGAGGEEGGVGVGAAVEEVVVGWSEGSGGEVGEREEGEDKGEDWIYWKRHWR